MDRFFQPKRIGIIGVSESAGNLGKLVLRNLVNFGFEGSFYAVGMESGTVLGNPIYRSILDVPDELDMAMILVKAEAVPQVVEECAQKGIKRLVIGTAGFSEYRPERKVLEDRLLETCGRHGIRFVGPNCLTVVNMHNGLCLFFTIQNRNHWEKGPVGIISQSGAIAMMYGKKLSYGHVGVGKIASIGNRLNVDEVDLLEYYLKDPLIEIIFLYLEGFSRAQEFFELACSATKPIVAIKSNTSSLSAGIASSHTTALASDDRVVDAAFKQAGIIRVNNFEELSDCVKALLLPPLKGNRLVGISRAGGEAVMIADECARNGFTLPRLPSTFYNRIQSKGRAEIISLTNPLDLGDIFSLNALNEIVDEVIDFPDIDGIFYNVVYEVSMEELFSYQEVFDHCSQVNRHSKIPVFIRLSIDALSALNELRKRVPIPMFESISGAFKAMRQVTDAQAVKPVIRAKADVNIDPSGKIASVLYKAVKSGKNFLDYEQYEILQELQIPLVNSNYISRDKADRIINRNEAQTEFPVALKAIGGSLVHKTELGGVRLNILNETELSDALSAMLSEPRLSSAHGFLIQKMIGSGIEMIVGGRRDSQFGPLVIVGFGGVLVELFSDIKLALAPVDLDMSERMVKSLKGYRLLEGYRGSPPADLNPLYHIIVRISDLMIKFPHIAEIDLNPVKVLNRGEGCFVIDSKIFLNHFE